MSLEFLPDASVIYEDNHLLVLNKPAMIPTMGTERETGLTELARGYLKKKYNKPGNVFLGVVSRLDSWVSGVLVFARTSKAAARLNDQFRERTVSKSYVAIVSLTNCPAGTGAFESGVPTVLKHLLRKDDGLKRMTARDAGPGVEPLQASRDEQFAELEYLTLAGFNDQRLLRVKLVTGRKHQIRVQLAANGAPLDGDRKYGSNRPFPVGLALHSFELSLAHPVSRARLDFRASLPEYWPKWAKKELV